MVGSPRTTGWSLHGEAPRRRVRRELCELREPELGALDAACGAEATMTRKLTWKKTASAWGTALARIAFCSSTLSELVRHAAASKSPLALSVSKRAVVEHVEDKIEEGLSLASHGHSLGHCTVTDWVRVDGPQVNHDCHVRRVRGCRAQHLDCHK